MIISNITLTNIGAYRGYHNIDFTTEDNKNVILIGGENGAGKTTLLNAIKLGLFGAYSFGFKTENTEYYSRVESILNHHAKRNEENDYSIRIKFTLVDGYKKVNYDLNRQWKFNSGTLKETYYLIANGTFLNEEEKDQFNTKLKEVMPPHLLDLCLFDGEEISRIVSEDRLSEYLKKLSKVVFNLDLFELLENDLEKYSKLNLDVDKMESSELELYEANKKEQELRLNIANKMKLIAELKVQQTNIQDEYNILKSDFENYGGLVKSQREETLTKISSIENERKQRNEEVRQFVSSLLPFYLAKPLLKATRAQIQNESDSLLFNELENRLTSKKIQELLKSLKLNDSADVEGKMKNGILNIIKPSNDVLQIHNASFSESSLIENIYLQIENNDLQHYLDKIIENKDQLEELSELRKKVRVNDSTNEFADLLNKIEVMGKDLQHYQDEIIVHENLLAEWTQSLEDTLDSIHKIQIILKNRDKTVSSFAESQKIIALSRRFRELQVQKKLHQIQVEATNMLKRILRKQNYVESIFINSSTYEVSLKDSHNNSIEKRTLSAGEKQILLISIIWAIFKISGRKVPFIFDTLLGRLDKTHKAAVLTEFIPSCGKQAIILATDSEIDEKHYELLTDHLTKEYRLEFDPITQETTVLDQYFSFK
ncbi:DNA sulfur modification protein DndD [Viridibacillus arvi]|uniref:DNA sulfur modification protein DndD n=1 Tax=Viridibacillus arvi TaxID=263475 RepID=UPI0034CE3CB7